MNGLTDDMKRFLLAQTLMGAAQPMLAASAPSTDPRNKSFGYALSQGIGGMQQGQQQGMAGIMARMQMEDAMKRRAAREQLAGQIGQPPQQGIASMMGGGTMLDSGQVLPQGQTMMGNRVVPQGLAGLIGTPEFADAMKLYAPEPKKFGSASAGATIYDETSGEVKYTVPTKNENNLPYKIGGRQKYTGKDGKQYEGTFKGLTDTNEPVFENVNKVEEKSTEMKEGTKEYLYGQVVSQFDNDDTVKQFRKTQLAVPYIKKAEQLYKETGNAGILQDALIYSHNKILDADSVVMVSEYLRAKGQSNLLDRMQGNVYKLYEGSAGLGPEQQKIMLNAVKFALDEKTRLYDQRAKAHRTRASRYVKGANELNEMFPTSDIIFGGTTSTKKPVSKGGSKFEIIEVK